MTQPSPEQRISRCEPSPAATHTGTARLCGAALAMLIMQAGCGDGEHMPRMIPDALIPSADGASPAPDAGESNYVNVQILAFNDFHGHLEPPEGPRGRIQVGTMPDGSPQSVDAGGVVHLARHVADLRATQPNTVVVSAGDLFGASPLLSALFHDEPTIEAMNLLGLDLNAVGHHELDDGTAELLRMQYGGCNPVDGCQDGTPFTGATFAFLAANVATGADNTIFPPYEIRAFDGVQVAFIGVTLEDAPALVSPAGVAGLEFRDEVETVNALVPALREQGVRAIVVLLHEGGIQAGLHDECAGISGPIVEIVSAMDDEVDVVVTGHTHQAYNCLIDGKRVTSAASFGRLITDIDMALDPITGDVARTTARNVIVTRDGAAAPDVQALLDHYDAIAAPLRDRVIGHVTARLGANASLSGESALGSVIADAQHAATRAQAHGGAVVAFANPGNIGADIEAGEVTYGEAFAAQPLGHSLVVMTLTGAQIDALLEQQFTASGARILQVSAGFSYTWQASAPIGQKVDASAIVLDGVPVAPAATYRIAVDSFLASGGNGFSVLLEGTERLGGALNLDALVDYLQANDPLSPPAPGRITRAP